MCTTLRIVPGGLNYLNIKKKNKNLQAYVLSFTSGIVASNFHDGGHFILPDL